MATTKELLEELEDKYYYKPFTGEFIRKSDSGRYKAGEVAGTTATKTGYRCVRAANSPQYVHRMAFLMTYGWLPEEIDHIDHDRKNNKIFNLRAADRYINGSNITLKKSNSSGFNGIYFCNTKKKWKARIMVKRKNISLGYHDNLDDAITARKIANIKYGFHENHGKAKQCH